jgi:hypothetical protein
MPPITMTLHPNRRLVEHEFIKLRRLHGQLGAECSSYLTGANLRIDIDPHLVFCERYDDVLSVPGETSYLLQNDRLVDYARIRNVILKHLEGLEPADLGVGTTLRLRSRAFTVLWTNPLRVKTCDFTLMKVEGGHLRMGLHADWAASRRHDLVGDLLFKNRLKWAARELACLAFWHDDPRGEPRWKRATEDWRRTLQERRPEESEEALLARAALRMRY